MDKRFFNLFNLSEDQAIAILQTPFDQIEDETDRYIAASHLVNFNSERSINALIEAVENDDSHLYNRIARRKAIETLGRLNASTALPVIRRCLKDEDCYTVENAVWAIGEIGTDEVAILEEIAQILDRPQQSYRVIIQTLAKFNYQNALDRIKPFIESDDEPIASAAMTAVARLTGDEQPMQKVVEFLTHSSVNARRACIQDLIDAQYYEAIPQISRCPVSIVFRLRGIRLLAETGMTSGKISFEQIEPHLDRVICDRPDELVFVHEYDQPPSLEFLIRELYHTDFGRCYLASQTLLESYPEQAAEAMLANYEAEAYNDYGAHYHMMKLWGWLKYEPAKELLITAFNNRAPQFQKSRAAAAISLANLGDKQVISLLKEGLQTKVFDLKYACLLGLENLGDTSGREIALNDDDFLIRSKAIALS